MLENLLSRIGGSSFSEEDDSWSWVWSKKGRFTVKSMYEDLIDEKFARIGNKVVFPSHLFWGMDLPMNIKLFFWCLFLGKTLTRQTLVNRGLDISVYYPMCSLLPESTEQLFLHCPLMLELWVWSYLPYAVAWVAWKFRNNMVFYEVVPQISSMKLEIEALTWYWCGNWGGRNSFRFKDVVANWEGFLAGTVAATSIG
ncbi:hypothetical protein FRX31_007440 [Thalictrum thalictroides]|uniref:Reverse transcriptase zinc-binding domain-containing protein n=1 Tax=Thalictrum thalictroides TaxID=46969 RepID=A0A7J6WZT1_THATH|nr:hypothetical protein FRX31_007440 [Thalictrum thalictroides]